MLRVEQRGEVEEQFGGIQLRAAEALVDVAQHLFLEERRRAISLAFFKTSESIEVVQKISTKVP